MDLNINVARFFRPARRIFQSAPVILIVWKIIFQDRWQPAGIFHVFTITLTSIMPARVLAFHKSPGKSG
jgi:hypothetical protein